MAQTLLQELLQKRFQEAIEHEQEEDVERVIKATGINVNEPFKSGFTPLELALLRAPHRDNGLATVKVLIVAGAQYDLTDVIMDQKEKTQDMAKALERQRKIVHFLKALKTSPPQ